MADSTAIGATFISAPGQPAGANATGPTAPGATGPASTLTVHQSAILLIFGSMAALLVVGYVFRRGPIER